MTFSRQLPEEVGMHGRGSLHPRFTYLVFDYIIEKRVFHSGNTLFSH